jgi:hypothetical protein
VGSTGCAVRPTGWRRGAAPDRRGSAELLLHVRPLCRLNRPIRPDDADDCVRRPEGDSGGDESVPDRIDPFRAKARLSKTDLSYSSFAGGNGQELGLIGFSEVHSVGPQNSGSTQVFKLARPLAPRKPNGEGARLGGVGRGARIHLSSSTAEQGDEAGKSEKCGVLSRTAGFSRTETPGVCGVNLQGRILSRWRSATRGPDRQRSLPLQLPTRETAVPP